MAQSLPSLGIAFTEGDRLPELKGGLKSDLTDCTVTLKLRRPTTVLTKTATIDDASNGQFHFDWADDDLVAGIGQEAMIQVTDADGLVTTLLRFTIDVRAGIE